MYEYIDTSGVPWAQMCDKYPREVARWVEATTREWKDDLKPMAAVDKVHEAILRASQEEPVWENGIQTEDWVNYDILAQELNIHDDLPEGVLLPCPVCGKKCDLVANEVSCRFCDFKITWVCVADYQQAINAANVAIRELRNATND